MLTIYHSSGYTSNRECTLQEAIEILDKLSEHSIIGFEFETI